MRAAVPSAPRRGLARPATEPFAPDFAAGDVDIPFPEEEDGLGVGDAFVRLRFAGRRGAPTVLALGGISAGRRVADGADGEGWWRGLVRPGGGVDLDRYAVFGADFFPLAPARPVALAPADYARVFRAALRTAGVGRLHAAVGGSFGGMIALALARLDPGFAGRIAVLCAAARPSVLGAALRGIQRDIVRLAFDAGDGPAGVALARRLAMTTYRTPEEFAARFSAPADIERYLFARGADYATRMSAARYLTLSAAIDRHDETPEAILAPALVVAAVRDQLVPVEEARDLARRLGGGARLVELDSSYGHDAFLKEESLIAPALDAFLKERH